MRCSLTSLAAAALLCAAAVAPLCAAAVAPQPYDKHRDTAAGRRHHTQHHGQHGARHHHRPPQRDTADVSLNVVVGEPDCSQSGAPCPFCLRAYTLESPAGNVTLHEAIRDADREDSCPGDAQCTAVSAELVFVGRAGRFGRQLTVAFHCAYEVESSRPAQLPSLGF
ncbi:hypothetical protein FJT64_016320 [Amphibalanus amphitrite]|uniref:ZP domain-containing protein n=1 Tax=Amphibalanus amphitrite TaxID=1232801 RepID=A0A6A4WZZ3_AMPAM|nr:hypothetical protein FJT64_016320 [Amphibalanus amphitrite]